MKITLWGVRMENINEDRKLYQYVCENCGRAIISTGKKRIIKCERCLKAERSKRYRSSTSSLYRKFKRNSDIFADVREIENYNKTHGTNYSYGQFKALLTLGKIDL